MLNKLSIWALSLYGRADTLEEYQRKSRHFLTGFQRSRPEFGRLLAAGAARTRVISRDLTTLGEDIASLVFDEGQLSDYLKLSDGKNLSIHSLSKLGFSVSYASLDEDSGMLLPLERGGMSLRLQGASASVESETSVVLELAAPSAISQEIKELLAYVTTNWRCTLGGVVQREYQRAVTPGNTASYAGQWLYYLPFPHLANCLPNDIHHEPFANGILIQTTPHIPDANNPEDIAAGIRVREVLDEFGMVNDATYAIEGWPPDREEEIYEQFISGAPANRKYTVHCINFDGYDSQRKVLLYAKLFRRLKRHPKEWGHRGWDGPVLNEAKRQVRAAAKAGGVKIEWHIGLEEPAFQVRQLLADYTDITEQQLQVIYTPLEEALTHSQPT